MVFKKGNKGYWAGKKRSLETKQKIGDFFKGKTYEQIMGIENAIKRKEKQGEMLKGVGNPFYNKKHNAETKEIMSKKKEGKNHWGWKNGDAYFRNKFRRAVRKRDNYICIMCGVHQEKLARSLEVHHINYDKNFHLLQNGISLCASCHHKPHNKFINKKHWINFFQNLLKERYNYNYDLLVMEVVNV